MSTTAARSTVADRPPDTATLGPLSGARGVAPVTVGPLDVLRVLNAAGGALSVQARLHGRLALLEWQCEKRRLSGLLGAAVIGVAGLQCLLLLAGAVGVASAWNSAYRWIAVAAVAALYGFMVLFAVYRLQLLLAQGADAFAATRRELAADAALLRSRL